MIIRNITETLSRLEAEFPVVTITGPRQSGKTTLVKEYFNNHEYVSLENKANLRLAQVDPQAFLSLHPSPVIFDEAQRCPELFSYLQEIVDANNTPGKFILTGSQNFLLLKSISQSLAGRVGITYLLPLELSELNRSGINFKSIEDALFGGFYPRVYDQSITPHDFYLSYVRTYLERDVSDELGVRKTIDFRKNLTLCALRIGNLLEVSSLSKAVQVNTLTIKSWLSLLETSFIVFRLQPYYKNFGKRLVKSPKLYFVDTGLVCHLLNVKNSRQIIEDDNLRGKLFENFVIAEVLKKYYNKGLEPNIYFWRDTNGREIDLVIESGGKIAYAVEIKSSTTINLDYFKNLNSICNEIDLPIEKRIVIYGGKASVQTKFGRFMTVDELDELVV